MQQQVAIARALATNPSVLLLDEPFGALDLQIQGNHAGFPVQTQQRTGLTVLLITHDVEEALVLAQRVYVLAPNPGRIIRSLDVNLNKGDLDKLRLSGEFLQLRRAFRIVASAGINRGLMAPNEFPAFAHLLHGGIIVRWDRSQYAGHWWHPVGSAWDLQPGHSLAVKLLGQQLLLTRPDEGPPMAFRNRCPHRWCCIRHRRPHPNPVSTSDLPLSRLDLQPPRRASCCSGEQTMLTGFERSEWNLEPLPCQVDGPLIWVSLDSSAVPLNQQLTQLHQEVDQAWRKPLVQVGKRQSAAQMQLENRPRQHPRRLSRRHCPSNNVAS